MSTLAQRLQAEINRANAATSKTDTTVHDAIGSLIDGYGKENVTWHQCPELVRDYLKSVTYDPSDYSTSRIAEFAPASAVQSNTKPIGKTVDGVPYYNEVPNLETPFSSAKLAGIVKPLDSLRWLNTETINVRDLGGWVCDGGTVKYGMLVRGGEPKESDKDLMVDKVGVRAELNLRGDEVEMRTSSVWGIEYFHPFTYAWYSISNKALWKQLLSIVFGSVNYGVPLYFHCHAGADRTGTLACVLEALLGVSQSDIDKDYELTCFYSGTETDTSARRRNESEWQGLINAIQAVPLEGGLTDSFRNRAVSFVLSLGFTVDEINAFRTAMINGNPSAISVSMDTYSVTANGSNVTFDNDIASVDEYQSYELNLSADSNYAISDIVVTMGGVDVTRQVFSGEKTTLNRSVSSVLSHCSMTGEKWVIDGQSYVAELTADKGYTLDGGVITITMGGVDVSTYYSKGKISIPKVTGNIEITVTAVPSASTFSFTMARNLTGGRTKTGISRDAWAVSPPSEDYAFGEFRNGDAVQNYASVDHDVYTNMTENSVSVTNSASGNSVCYPFEVQAGKTYTFKWTAEGTPRVYIGRWVDGAWTTVSNPQKSTTGDCEQSFIAPEGATFGAICFGAGTGRNAQYTNVSVNESQETIANQ